MALSQTPRARSAEVAADIGVAVDMGEDMPPSMEAEAMAGAFSSWVIEGILVRSRTVPPSAPGLEVHEWHGHSHE
jgi:hypothetical protein